MPEDMEEKKKDETEDAQMADEGMDVKAIVKAIESGEISVADMEAIVAAISAREGAGEEDSMEEPDVVDEPVAAMSHANEAEEMKLSGRVAGLEAYRDQVESEKRVNSLFSAAIASLEGDGFNVPEGVRDRFKKAAEKGEDMLRLFSDNFRDTSIQDPSEDFVGFPSGEQTWPEEVASYSHKSPELFAAAKTAFREWSEMPDDRHRSPLDRYLRREVG